MTGCLNQDFAFGNEIVTSLTYSALLAQQGANLKNTIQAAGGNQYSPSMQHRPPVEW
jgi:hypothetical protein